MLRRTSTKELQPGFRWVDVSAPDGPTRLSLDNAGACSAAWTASSEAIHAYRAVEPTLCPHLPRVVTPTVASVSRRVTKGRKRRSRHEGASPTGVRDPRYPWASRWLIHGYVPPGPFLRERGRLLQRPA